MIAVPLITKVEICDHADILDGVARAGNANYFIHILPIKKLSYIYIVYIYILTDVFCNKITNLYILTNWYSKYTQITSLDLLELLSFNLFSQNEFFGTPFPCDSPLQISDLFLPH